MSYRIGDKITIKKDLVAGNTYGRDIFAREMNIYLGKTLTVTRIASNGGYMCRESNTWVFTDEMIEHKMNGSKISFSRTMKILYVMCEYLVRKNFSYNYDVFRHEFGLSVEELDCIYKYGIR